MLLNRILYSFLNVVPLSSLLRRACFVFPLRQSHYSALAGLELTT